MNRDIAGMSYVARSCLLLFVATCGPNSPHAWRGSADATPADAPALGFEPGMPLGDLLDRIVAQMDSAEAGELQDASTAHIRRAETLTDRLPEARAPFAWLQGDDYSLEARLWQIQARADRLISLVRVGAGREVLQPEAEALRAEAVRLRQALSTGGRPAPAPIDQLLLQLDTARR